MKRRTLALGGVAALAAFGGIGTALWRLRSAAAAAPDGFWSLRFERPEGGELALAGLRGQPLLLNFWATWCAPCITELPLLDRFQREQRARGWSVVALAVDSPTPVREFLTRQPLGMAVGLAGLTGVELARSLGNGNGGLPYSVVFDRAGAVHGRKLGTLVEADLQKWAQALA